MREVLQIGLVQAVKQLPPIEKLPIDAHIVISIIGTVAILQYELLKYLMKFQELQKSLAEKKSFKFEIFEVGHRLIVVLRS